MTEFSSIPSAGIRPFSWADNKFFNPRVFRPNAPETPVSLASSAASRLWTEIVNLRAPGLLGCALSGAGPSILVFYEKEYAQVCDLVRQIFALHGHASETLPVHIAKSGYEMG